MIRRGSRCAEENPITSTSVNSACPPQKPPRGCPRKAPVRIEPLRNVGNDGSRQHPINSPAPSHCKFSTTEKYQNMKNYFRQRVELLRQNGVFSGSEAVAILDEYLQTNREQFSGQIVKRENAIKVLEVWLRENVISPVQATCKDSLPVFQDSKKVMYSMNPDEDHKLYICASPMIANRDSGRRPSRSSSFKRFFSPGRLKHSEATTSGHNMLSRSPSSVSESSYKSHRIVDFLPIHRNTDSRPLAEEAQLHDAALFRLLTIVEIPMLDDITTLHGQEAKSVSILSAILSKMGLGSVSAGALLFKDEEEMDDLLQNTPAIRPILPWFQMARICAPTLYFKSSGKPGKTEIHNWAKQSLQAVSERYASITRRGSSPLIPTEFTKVLDAIIHQLLGKKRNNTKLALQYLCLMIPQQIRSHLVNVIHFLQRTIGTDEWMSLRSPFYLGKKGDNENFEVVLNELRPFIFPQTIEICDQNSIVEVLMQLQKEGVLGKEPPELVADLKNMSFRANADKATVPIRFCEAESSSKGFDPEAELARALTAIIDDARIPLAEKQKKCELFKQHHPKMYRKYFAHLTW
ncbi:hypothetical protein Y032_0070g420 [Ancylostoma ceylanicum]|uniref:DEP domain-containing protein n=1 Tax=Ancylostoma ceylanicum TaxID=53326 RepID=A0A016TXB5_9BILA|nr:hypothetical protein Y032_0070g420 [Ancylostoma ceylanicum]